MATAELCDLAAWSKDPAQLRGVQQVLRSGLLDRARSGLGGSHTVVTYPPLDALYPISAQEITERVTATNRLNIYAHIAFCEFLCPFCHYDTTFTRIGGEGDLVSNYLDAILAEAHEWNSLLRGSTVSSIYIGGGTPTAIPEGRLLSVVASLSALPKTDDFCLCMETSPLTTVTEGGPSKLSSLISVGMNRLSMGVQTFDSKLLRRSRGHDRQVVLEALEMAMTFDIQVNVDLIQDLPDQSDQSIIEDLAEIERFRPHQVTWYIMRLRPEAAWYGRFRRSALNIAESQESLRRRLFITRGMEILGYIPQPGGRFVRSSSMHDYFKEVRSGTDSTLLGIGTSAYSHGWGYFFRNISSRNKTNGIRSYAEIIQQKKLPIESGYALDSTELTASKLVKGIRTCVSLPAATPETEDYLREASATIGALTEMGLVRSGPPELFTLTDLGRLFEEEICSLFYSPKVKNKLSASHQLWNANQEGDNRTRPFVARRL